MSVNVLYTMRATAIGGRDGRAATRDGTLEVKLTTPKELGGPGGPGSNPERLFAAGCALLQHYPKQSRCKALEVS
jgi:osmotically inducible protein OsmC